jgi:mRNA interferase MazF
MGQLHDTLESGGCSGHRLERFLVRILFCLFAEDTGIFERETFNLCLVIRTADDGSDLGLHLAQLFDVRNTPADKRQENLDETLAAFPSSMGPYSRRTSASPTSTATCATRFFPPPDLTGRVSPQPASARSFRRSVSGGTEDCSSARGAPQQALHVCPAGVPGSTGESATPGTSQCRIRRHDIQGPRSPCREEAQTPRARGGHLVIRQGDLYRIDPGQPSGSRPGNRHPHVVIQNDLFNASGIRTVVVCALTSNLALAEAPGKVRLRKGESGLPKESVVNVSQIFTLDRQDCTDKIGALSARRIREVIDGVRLVLEPRAIRNPG